MKLDAFDAQILNILQENNQITSAELASRIHLSQASCTRRIRRLRELGAIEADVAIVSPAAAGKSLTMIVQVSVERERPDLLDAFNKSIRRTPEITQCYYVTGEVDFVLVVSAADLAEYEAFTKRFFLENPNVRRFSTMVVMNRVKFSTMVPVSASAGE
jgi:Lrp/AsnC family leucine-responsive transcriptional regulator